MPMIGSGASLTPGLKNEHVYAYRASYKGVEEDLGDILWLNASSEGEWEERAIAESAPHPARWDVGKAVTAKGFNYIQGTTVNYPYGLYVPWHEDQRSDDRTGSLMDVARDSGRNWALLSERIAYQFIQGTSDTELLPAVPNSFDGIALYSSSTRYGSANGNVVGSQSSATIQGIILGLMAAHRRYKELLSSSGQPFWSDSETKKMKVLYGTQLTLVMAQALTQLNTLWKISGTSTTDTSTQSTMDNVLKTAGLDIVGLNSVRIADTDEFVFLRDLPVEKRPVFRQIREGLVEVFMTRGNSDQAALQGVEGFVFRSREGWGSPLAIATIQITN